MPKASVIIPVYNSSKYLSETIDSVLSQTYQDFEIVTVDDGSTDSSKEIIEKFIEKNPDKIKYIYQSNKGIAGARNTGIRNAKGEFIALLDADDKWHPQRLEDEVKVIESSKDIGLVHADMQNISDTGQMLSIPKREKKYLSGNIFEPLFLREAEIDALTVLFRKECCDKVGLFDEDPICMGVDDRDLWLRISRQYKIQYVDKVLAYYRVHEENYSKELQKMITARVYVVDKFCPSKGGNKKLRKMALTRIYKEAGDHFLFKQNFKEARQYYLKAIFSWPFNPWPWINLIKAILKIKVVLKHFDIQQNSRKMARIYRALLGRRI